MDSTSHSLKNGTATGLNGYHPANRPRRSGLRPLTVEEALPFTPFSSVVPFNSDIIPLPRPGLRSSTSLFSSAAERNETRQGLERLNKDASDPYKTSQKLQQTLLDLKQLLQPEKISQFKFKMAPNKSALRPTTPPELSLTPFSQILYDTTDPQYSYPTPAPETPSPKPMDHRPASENKKLNANHRSPSRLNKQQVARAVANSFSYDENSSITVHVPYVEAKRSKAVPQVVTPQESTPTRKNSGIAVVIPTYSAAKNVSSQSVVYSPPPSIVPLVARKTAQPQVPATIALKSEPEPKTPSAQRHSFPSVPTSGSGSRLSVVVSASSPALKREDYEALPDSPDIPQHLSRKRTYFEIGSEDALLLSLDQREKAELVFRSLRDQLQVVFEAEDQLHPHAVNSNPIFTTTCNGITLSASIQTKLASLLQKVISVDRFSHVPVDDLIRVQKLSEGAVKIAETIDITVDEAMGDSEFEAWMQRALIAELGLKAARTTLCIMSGGRDDKQIYSEDATQAALNAFKNATESCIIPIVEMRSSGSAVKVFQQLPALKKTITNLLTQCRRLLSLFVTLVASIELSETVVTTLEFVASRLIFVENAHGERDSILGIAKFDGLRLVAMDVLAQIFLKSPLQRQGIFDEILTSLEKLPVTKQSARQFKLSGGGSIQLVSALIMRLVQFSASTGSWDRVAVKYDGAYSHNALLEVSIETTLRISIWLRRAKAQALGFPIRGIGLDLRFPESLAEEHHKAWKAMYELSRIRSLEEKTFCCAISIVDFTGPWNGGKEERRAKALEVLDGGEDACGSTNLSHNVSTIRSEAQAQRQTDTAIQELRYVVSPLLDSAKSNASYVVGFIVNRAVKSTKTGDAPYRNLLDLFVEDFITCLNSIEWPAAELLLRLLLFKMVQLAEGEKTPAPAKNMALDLLGSMGAAISDLISHVRKTANSLKTDDAELGRYLSRQAQTSLESKVPPADLVSWACGPFRASLEFLDQSCSLDPHLSSAVSLYMGQWASKICSTYALLNDYDDEAAETQQEYGRLAYRLRMMIGDKKWLSTEYTFNPVSGAHARLAYSLTLLQSHFCESFTRVLTILLGSMTSEQATVRSKSLKSVTTVLETDPTILDREPAIMHLLLRCSNDPSVLVRDSALALIARCLSLRPSLEHDMIPGILQRVNDSGGGIRKRAMKLSKDIYLRNANPEIRSLIADSLLHRVTDQDESVQELARQTIEEVWMSPFYQSTSSNNTSAQFKLAMADHVALMVKTVQRGGSVSTVLDKVLQSILSNNARLAAANFKVCKSLVAIMFETIIDNSTQDGKTAPSARDALQVLTVFAKSNAKLFTPEQVQLLQPYVANLEGSDDLAIYRSVVIIFRHVLPHLSQAHNSFLASIRKELMPTISRMGKAILDDLVACLWIISEVLDDFQHLSRLVISSLTGIQRMKTLNLNDPIRLESVRKLNKLLLITGMCGKHCDLDRQWQAFRSSFPDLKETSVSALMAHTFAPFASPEQPLDVRKAALEAMGMVCQSWPKNFDSAKVWTQFLAAFEELDDERRTHLEAIAMRAIKDFLLLEEKRSEAGAEAAVGMAADPTAKLGIMGGGQGDGIAIALAQRFLKPVIKIALSRQDEQALLATEVMGCVIRQGLMHPKECTTALVALETSQNLTIAEIAFHEHRSSTVRHESILEKEYMRSVQIAYIYQRDVVKDTHGATLNPFAPKLHRLIEVLQMSKPKNRKRFFENLCARIDFDPEKMDIEDLPEHLEFSQFIIENMAFFEYVSIDELLTAIAAMERVVAGTGTGIAHAIETEVLHCSQNQATQIDEDGHSRPLDPELDMTRLQKLTASSMMLSCLWEARTYLRRQYGLMNNRRESKGKAAFKDLNKAPVKTQGINGDRFWEDVSAAMAAFESKETMIKQCRSFVELLSVDQDFKMAAEGDEDATRFGTPSDDEDNGSPGPSGGSGRGRKRKASSTPGGRKKRARSSSVPRPRGRPKASANKCDTVSIERNDDDDDRWN